MIPPLCVVFNPWFHVFWNCGFHDPVIWFFINRVFDHLDPVFHLVEGPFRPYFGPIFNNFPLLMHHPRYRRYDHDNAACQSDEDMKPAIHAGLYKYLPETTKS